MAEAFDLAAERLRVSNALVSGIGALDSEADAGRLLQSFADFLVGATPRFRLAWFFIGDPNDLAIRPQYCAGPQRAYGESLVIGRSRVYARGPVRRTLESGVPVVQRVPDTISGIQRLVPGVADWHRRALSAGVRSVLAMSFPLPNCDDKGLVVVYADREGYFDDLGLEPFVTVSRFVQIGLDRIGLREAEARGRDYLNRLSREDPLTGLLNRSGFEAAAREKQVADACAWVLLQLDIDDFSALNASAGSEVADEVLRETASRLSEFAGPNGLVARSGADDFMVAVPVSDLNVEAVARACQECLAKPAMVVEGRPLDVTAVVGATVVEMDETLEVSGRQRELAVAVSRARQEGGGGLCVYRRDAEVARGAPQGVLAAARAGLEARQFELWFQPQVTLGDKGQAIYGAEGLIRWRRGTQIVPPGEFIDAVERSPLIRDLGRYALAEALECLDGWGGAVAPRVAVNIGVRHLLDAAFTDEIDAAFERYPNVPSSAVTFEITERAALSDVDRVCEVLSRLRSRGLRIALDDFGTGHAALTHLQVLPLDYLKLDRSFVTDLDSNPARFAIAKGLLTTAKGLGLGVVAEGVEHPGEAVTLAELGCGIAQGFYYARPMPRSDFEAWCGEYGARMGREESARR